MLNAKVHIAATEDIPRWGVITSLGALADSGNGSHEHVIIGVTDGEMKAGYWGDATMSGLLFDKDWTWTPGAPIYLNGTVLSETTPGVGFVKQLGWALTTQSVLINTVP